MKKTLSSLIIPVLMLAALASRGAFASAESAFHCGFLRDSGPELEETFSGWKKVTVADYFVIHYRPGDLGYSGSYREGIPDILKRQLDVIERSRHFLETQMGWKLPATRRELNRPEIDVYIVRASKEWRGTVRMNSGIRVILNRNVLTSPDFPSYWIHQLIHAAEWRYRKDGDLWFFEATAGWMEGQFDHYSRDTTEARRWVWNHPDVSLTDSSPVAALGASRFLDLLGRPHRDVIRQIWERWSYSPSSDLMSVIGEILDVNHLPSTDSYLLNYFLPARPAAIPSHSIIDIVLLPYSALSIQEWGADDASGGVNLDFESKQAKEFLPAILFYSADDSEGTLSWRARQSEAWSTVVPFSNMQKYRVIIVNPGPEELRGTVRRHYDSTIPAVVEYFHASSSGAGIQLEWKTSRENGVAFWNLYRIRDGKKEQLNYFPIPGTVQSQEGIRYVFFDESGSGYYTLEAITADGFPGRAGGAQIAE